MLHNFAKIIWINLIICITIIKPKTLFFAFMNLNISFFDNNSKSLPFKNIKYGLPYFQRKWQIPRLLTALNHTLKVTEYKDLKKHSHHPLEKCNRNSFWNVKDFSLIYLYIWILRKQTINQFTKILSGFSYFLHKRIKHQTKLTILFRSLNTN